MTSEALLTACDSSTKRSRVRHSHAIEVTSSLIETRPTNAHRHGVRSKTAAAIARMANPPASASPVQMPYQSFGRFAGSAISATNAGYRILCFAEELSHLREQLHEIERFGEVAVGERAELDGARRLVGVVVDRAHQQHGRPDAPALDVADELEPVLARQLDVDEA